MSHEVIFGGSTTDWDDNDEDVEFDELEDNDLEDLNVGFVVWSWTVLILAITFAALFCNGAFA